MYLHRRVNRANGGVEHILAKAPGARIAGVVTLSEPDAADLKLGKLYVTVVSRTNPLVNLRSNLRLA